jgi:hypothetical protein
LSFLRPLFLYLLPLSLFPIILHLLGRRLERRKPFPWIALLLKTEAEGRRVNRIYEWLILLSRFLIILSVILAFSGPIRGGIRGVEGIFVDVSNSMFPLKDKVEEILDEISKKFPSITPIYFADGVIEQGEFRISYRGTDFTVLNSFRELKKPIIISDFQKTGAKGKVNLGSPYLINLHQEFRNIGIVGVRSEVPYVFHKKILELRVKVRNYSRDKIKSRLKIESDSVVLGERDFSIDPLSTSEIKIEIPSHGASYRIGIGDEGIPGDDVYYMLIPAFDTLRVVLIGSKGDFRFIKAALKPVGLDSPFKIRELEGIKTFGEISESDLLIVTKMLNDREFRYIERYMEEGGRVIVFYNVEPFASFEEREEGTLKGFKGVRLQRYRILKDGLPFLYDDEDNPIGVSLRDGKLYLLGWMPKLDYTDFVLSPEFVPFLMEKVSSLVGLERYFYGKVGNLIKIPVSKEGLYTVLYPEGFKLRIESKGEHGERYIELGPFEKPGFYRIFNNGKLEAILAINFDPAEGNPEGIENINEIFQNGKLLDVGEIRERDYSGYLFLLAILFALTEMGLVALRRRFFR